MKRIFICIFFCLLINVSVFAEKNPMEKIIDSVITRPWSGDNFPALPTLTEEIKSKIINEITKSDTIYEIYKKMDASKYRNVEWFENIKKLEKHNAVWCLVSCLSHPSEDVQIRALESLKRLNNKDTVEFLLVYAEHMAVFEHGSENATIHGIIHEEIANTLSSLTDIKLSIKSQNPDKLKSGIKQWKKWLTENSKSISKYILSIKNDNISDSTNWKIYVNDNSFQNIAELKKFILKLPRNSLLEWNPGCDYWDSAPLYDEKEYEDLKNFCIKNKIKLIRIPSG